MHETVFKIGCTFHHVIWELKLGTLCYLWHNPSSLLHNLVLAEHLPGGNTIRAKSYSHQSEIRKGKMVRSNVRLNLWRYPDTQIDQWISHHSYYNSDCEVNGYLGKIQAAYGTGSTTWPLPRRHRLHVDWLLECKKGSSRSIWDHSYVHYSQSHFSTGL